MATYVLSFRATLLLVGSILLCGALGGGIASALFFRFSPPANSGQRIVERVEQGSVQTFSDVVQGAAEYTVALVEDTGDTLAHGFFLTTDGLVLLPLQPLPHAAVRLRRADGSVLSAAVVKEYPELSVSIVKADVRLSHVPDIPSANLLVPGVEMEAVRVPADTSTVSAQHLSLTALRPPSSALLRTRPALLRVGTLTPSPVSGSSGAPLLNIDGAVVGMVLQDGDQAVVMPGGELAAVLRDVLRAIPQPESVSVLDGIHGVWSLTQNGKHLSWRLDRVPASSPAATAGLQEGDVVTELNGSTLDNIGSVWGMFADALRAKKPVSLRVTRGDTTQDIAFTPGQL